MGKTNGQNFDALISPLEDILLCMIWRKVGDAEIVREIYHEVYLAGLVNLHQLREVEKFPAWICAITRNAIHAYWKKERKKKAREIPMDFYGPSNAQRILANTAIESAEETALSIDENNRLAEALAALDPTEQMILKLAYYGSLPQKEIADILGISLSALKMRKARAIKKLRERFNGTL